MSQLGTEQDHVFRDKENLPDLGQNLHTFRCRLFLSPYFPVYSSSVFQTCLLHKDPLFWIPRVTGRLPAVRGLPSPPRPSPTRVPTAVCLHRFLLWQQQPGGAWPSLAAVWEMPCFFLFSLSESKYLKSRAEAG